MRLFNTLTNQLDEVKADNKGVVTVYCCGPTVYNNAQIGNMRTYVTEDLLRRALVAAGYTVKAVMNLTDVDDKTIAKSQSEYPDLTPMEALGRTTRHYEDLFKRDLAALGVDLSLVTFVRATEQIPSMQAMVRDIYARGYAYIAEGSVYFDLSKYRADGNNYGRLTNVDFSPQARIDNDEYDKEEARDFVLWKAAKDDEPFWEFELDGHDVPGRPGWHIECSAMATQALGQPISVHSGGIDLKFPHHENEIAQVVAATGHDFANLFTHQNHLLVDGRRMGKSLGNFYILDDVTAKGYHPLALRLRYLQAAHSSELNFTWESLEAAQNALGNLYAWADSSLQAKPAAEFPAISSLNDLLANDLATPQILEALAASNHLVPSSDLLSQLDGILGLGLANRPDIDQPTKDLIIQREAARTAKDWAKADGLRDQLAAQNIEIDDTPQGPRWRRTRL